MLVVAWRSPDLRCRTLSDVAARVPSERTLRFPLSERSLEDGSAAVLRDAGGRLERREESATGKSSSRAEARRANAFAARRREVEADKTVQRGAGGQADPRSETRIRVPGRAGNASNRTQSANSRTTNSEPERRMRKPGLESLARSLGPSPGSQSYQPALPTSPTNQPYQPVLPTTPANQSRFRTSLTTPS